MNRNAINEELTAFLSRTGDVSLPPARPPEGGTPEISPATQTHMRTFFATSLRLHLRGSAWYPPVPVSVCSCFTRCAAYLCFPSSSHSWPLAELDAQTGASLESFAKGWQDGGGTDNLGVAIPEYLDVYLHLLLWWNWRGFFVVVFLR